MKGIERKTKIDGMSKGIIFLFASSSIVALVLMVSFILKEAIPSYKEFGFFHMYFTSDFSTEGGYGIWSALTITLLTSIISVAIALPLSLRTAIFIRFRVKRGKKTLKTMVSTLAGVPSVVFGIFALKSLKLISDGLFNVSSPYTLINSILMLSIMIFPTITSLIYNQLKLVDDSLLKSSMALGNTKTYSIYKVIKPSIKHGINVAVITALGRAIGETMALSMVLSSPSGNIFDSFSDLPKLPFASLGVEISRRMFQDGSNDSIRSALFAAGIALFVLVMILVAIMNRMSKKRNLININPIHKFNKNEFRSKYIKFLYIAFLPFKLISYFVSLITFKLGELLKLILYYIQYPIFKLMYPERRNNQSRRNYYHEVSKSRVSKVDDFSKIILESLSMIIVLGSAAWIFLDVLITGVPKWEGNDWKFSYINSSGKQIAGDIMNPLIWTIVLLEISILIALPFALGTALFLSEYARNKHSGRVVRFFLDSLGGTPSILFGIFGVIFFLDTMGLRNQVGSTSLIAGALTMTLVILPTFTRTIEQVLIRIPDTHRNASYALGASKFETIRKIILPQAIPGIATGIILSIGRIISETAPIYLTLGMFAGTDISLMSPGHTITTDILNNQLFSSMNAETALEKSYKLAAVAIILVAIITSAVGLLEKNTKTKRKKVTNVKRNII